MSAHVVSTKTTETTMQAIAEMTTPRTQPTIAGAKPILTQTKTKITIGKTEMVYKVATTRWKSKMVNKFP